MKNKGKLSSRILAALWMTGTISLTTTAQELRQIWHQEHSTTLSGYGRAIAFDADNNVFQLWSAGTNVALVKYSGGGGAILWQKHLAADVWQVPIDAEGNPLVFGRDEDLDNDGTTISEFYSAKLDGASGAVLWEKRYRDENGAALFVNNFALDSSGNLVAMGRAVTSTNHTTLVIKYSGVSGDILWQERFSPTAAQDVGALAVSTNGDVAVVRANGAEFHVSKLNGTSGKPIWATTHSPSSNTVHASDITLDADGNIAITGGDLSDSGDRMYTAKFASADGDLMWEDWIAAPLPLGDAEGSRVVSLPNGDIAALGRRGPETVNQAPGAYIVRYEAGTGAELWSMRYDLFPGPSTAHLDLSRIVFDPSDESLVFGTATVAFTVSSSRSATYKVDAGSGLVLWQLTHTNLNFPYFAYKADLLALSGESHSNDAVAQLFRGGPELTVQWVSGEVEFSWPEQYQGWRLQRLNTNDSLAGTWSTVPGSEDAVSVRVPVTEGSLGLFQLAR